MPPEVCGGWNHLATDEHSGSLDPRPAAPNGDTEATQHVETAHRAVQGVGSEVEVEAGSVPGASAAAEVLGALDDGDGPPGANQRGGGSEAGEPAADHDRSISVHDKETIDAPAL